MKLTNVTGLITKEYIKREYAQTIREYQCAHTEDEQWQARKTMARLENIAMYEFGFEYADEIAKMKDEM